MNNTAARAVLNDYVKMDNPQYALLVEAPWGAGKTHFVKDVLQNILLDRNARYVSLNGIDTPQTFQRALVIEDMKAVNVDAAASISDRLKTLTGGIDLGAALLDFYKANRLANLPDTLIFDDLERCHINLGVLLGLINDFVEQQEKRVVIVAHLEKHKDHKNYLSQFEKLIGQTVNIKADAATALPIFINQIADGHGKTWLLENYGEVIRIFTDAGHNNLRVLRQTTRALAKVIDQFEADILSGTFGVKRFARTYLALAMALAVGVITKKDVEQRGESSIFRKKEGVEPHNLWNLYEMHEHDEVLSRDGASTISTELGIALLCDGYVEAESLNSALRMTKDFITTEEKPFWSKFVFWWELSDDDLATSLEQAENYLFENENIEAGPFLHIANCMLDIERRGNIKFDQGMLCSRVLVRIEELRKHQKLPPAKYGQLLGWSSHMSGFSFGGYGVEPKGDFKSIVETMKNAQLAMFRDNLPEEVKTLLSLLETDISGFAKKMVFSNDGASYFLQSILDQFDVEKFADAIMLWMLSGQNKDIGVLLKNLAERHSQNGVWEAEQKWATELRAALEERAVKKGPLFNAKLQQFLSFYWRFNTSD